MYLSNFSTNAWLDWLLPYRGFRNLWLQSRCILAFILCSLSLVWVKKGLHPITLIISGIYLANIIIWDLSHTILVLTSSCLKALEKNACFWNKTLQQGWFPEVLSYHFSFWKLNCSEFSIILSGKDLKFNCMLYQSNIYSLLLCSYSELYNDECVKSGLN